MREGEVGRKKNENEELPWCGKFNPLWLGLICFILSSFSLKGLVDEYYTIRLQGVLGVVWTLNGGTLSGLYWLRPFCTHLIQLFILSLFPALLSRCSGQFVSLSLWSLIFISLLSPLFACILCPHPSFQDFKISLYPLFPYPLRYPPLAIHEVVSLFHS